jgi:glucosamine-6-phosphate deaminase
MPEAKVRSFRAGTAKFEVYRTAAEMGHAAAHQAANAIHRLASKTDTVPVVFATGAAQFATLEVLTSMPGIPWEKVVGFHMDEYLDLPADHPGSFRRYMREHLHSKVPMKKFYGMEADQGTPEQICREYAALLAEYRPQLCLLGIGENGHLAFNEPGLADPTDPLNVKIVEIDSTCRNQQLAEGWFQTLDEVPTHAVTLTIPTLFRIPELIASVPGPRKAQIIKKSVQEPVSPQIPATLLREHPNVTIYLDEASASQL